MTDTEHLIRTIEQSGYFDAAWYAARYSDVILLKLRPAEHYLRMGAKLLRDPGPGFSTSYYLAMNPDVASAGVNPLWHYVAHGRDEGRTTAPWDYRLQVTQPDSPVPLLKAAPLESRPAKLISFYLPQFHSIAENDEWWGEGFTEWTNVKPAQPQFPGHYQPHTPGDLGYYDLRDTAVQHRQVELAKLYGIEGFCFYFYWFAGKRLLETPVRNYLRDHSLDLPFCLCWANENWSRRWDGLDHEILIAQAHSSDDDLAFIAYVADYMRDPRYIRIDGKPLLLVYRPSLLPDAAATAKRWRNWCMENGLGEIYLAYTQSFESADPRDYGFDAAIEFPPNNSSIPLVTSHCRPHEDFRGKIYDWSALAQRSYAYQKKDYPLFRGLCPSWDNTARRGVNGTVLINATPAEFTRWASNAIAHTKDHFPEPDERLVFVNAWNEWAEGAHLEPDGCYGYAWLESLRVALARNADTRMTSATEARVAIMIGVVHPEGLPDILELVRPLPARHRLFVATTLRDSKATRAMLEASGRAYSLHVTPGHSRETHPLLAFGTELQAARFDLVVKLHALKRGKGQDSTRRLDMHAQLLANDGLQRVLQAFATDPTLGMVVAEGSAACIPQPGSARSRACRLQVGHRLGLSEREILGSDETCMYVARCQALDPLLSLAFPDGSLIAGSNKFNAPLATATEDGLALAVLAWGKRIASTRDIASAGSLTATDRVRPRLLVVSHDAHPHGAQLLALNMSRTFGELGFDVDLVVLGDGPMLARFSEVATVHRIDLARTAEWEILERLQDLRAAGTGVAIVNTTVSGPLVPLLKKTGFRVVSLIHELPGILNSYNLAEHAGAISLHADKIVFPAGIVQRGFETFVGHPLQQAVIRPQGLYLRSPYRQAPDRAIVRSEVRQRLGLAADARIILCAGYADHRKGLDLFVESCIKAMAVDPRVVALWVGHLDQSFFEQVFVDIRTAGLEDRFVFTGLVDHPQEFFAAADVYALTSREDPFPSVVMEAMDVRVPVVAFAGVGGFEELLGRGCGLIVPAFDTGAMARAFAKLFNDPHSAERLGIRGSSIIESEFSFRHYLHDLLALADRPLPRISVVVPNYNYARYINERLASVQGQTIPIYELIVLDDASSDNSVELIREALSGFDVPTRFIVNEQNSGSVFKQWRCGVEMARGDLVWIAEADDLADPDFLEQVLPAFSQPKIVMGYTQSRQMDSDGHILCGDYLDYVSDIDRERWTTPYATEGHEEISQALFVKNTIPNVSAVVFRREALLAVLTECEEEIFSYRNAGDWIVYLRLLEKGGVAYFPKASNSHRRHQGSVTVGNFNVNLLNEIVRVQRDTIRRHELGPLAMQKADLYAQELYEQFGLATDRHPRFPDHPGITTALAKH